MENVRIRMTETKKGCSNGLEVNTYKKGEKYSVSASLAEVFVKQLKVAKYLVRATENRIEPTPIETPEGVNQEGFESA